MFWLLGKVAKRYGYGVTWLESLATSEDGFRRTSRETKSALP